MKLPDVTSFLAVKEVSDKFVSDRDWGKFHQPKNIALALAGECGEIAEIFQWRGPLDAGINLNNFSEAEIHHIGEEIADVFIYSTRLCSICNIDLAKTVRYLIKGFEFEGTYYPVTNTWDVYSFEDLSHDILSSPIRLQESLDTKSPRDLAFGIQMRMGRISELFLTKKEDECVPGLFGWSSQDVHKLAVNIAYICILLSCLSTIADRALSLCISDKFVKNGKKYPVELVQGSSAKYTAYVDKLQSKQKKSSQFSTTFFLTTCVLTGVCGVLIGARYAVNHLEQMGVLNSIK